MPAFAAKEPVAEIEALLAGCLAEALDEPRIVLRVSDALFEAVQARIAAVVQAGGYSGKVVLLADAALAGGDGRVEWADGGAERDTSRIAQEIDAVLARALAAPPALPFRGDTPWLKRRTFSSPNSTPKSCRPPRRGRRPPSDLEAVYDIPVQISAVLGRATMQVSQLLKLGRGAVVELDRRVGEAIDIYVNNRLVARGEVVVVDERLGVTMTEIVKADRT